MLQLPFRFPPVAGRLALLAVFCAVLLGAAGGARAQGYINLTAGAAFTPGVYGQIAIGGNPPPPVLNAAPVVVGPPVYGAPLMYLHVPPYEYRHWRRYCGHYSACGRPVHFVRVDGPKRWWEPSHAHPGPYRGEAYGHRAWDRGEHRRLER